MTKKNKELIIITGLSGSGKTYALHTLEDIGYYCIDNLPVELIPTFLNLINRTRAGIRKIAIICDIREKRFLKNFEDTYDELKRKKLDTELIFLEAEDSVLARRYSETRRPHPLRDESALSAMIEKERSMLSGIREIADVIIDTSEYNVHQLKSFIVQKFASEMSSGDHFTVNVMSFGFKHGLPSEMDILLDVRFMPNPYFNDDLKDLSGLDTSVKEYVKASEEFKSFFPKLKDMLLYLIPRYRKEGKYYLHIAFGCTGGRHRSVTVAEEVFELLRAEGLNVLIDHRDIRLTK
jgi:UPF0042 nucleotide-binding protein